MNKEFSGALQCTPQLYVYVGISFLRLRLSLRMDQSSKRAADVGAAGSSWPRDMAAALRGRARTQRGRLGAGAVVVGASKHYSRSVALPCERRGYGEKPEAVPAGGARAAAGVRGRKPCYLHKRSATTACPKICGAPPHDAARVHVEDHSHQTTPFSLR